MQLIVKECSDQTNLKTTNARSAQHVRFGFRRRGDKQDPAISNKSSLDKINSSASLEDNTKTTEGTDNTADFTTLISEGDVSVYSKFWRMDYKNTTIPL